MIQGNEKFPGCAKKVAVAGPSDQPEFAPPPHPRLHPADYWNFPNWVAKLLPEISGDEDGAAGSQYAPGFAPAPKTSRGRPRPQKWKRGRTVAGGASTTLEATAGTGLGVEERLEVVRVRNSEELSSGAANLPLPAAVSVFPSPLMFPAARTRRMPAAELHKNDIKTRIKNSTHLHFPFCLRQNNFCKRKVVYHAHSIILAKRKMKEKILEK